MSRQQRLQIAEVKRARGWGERIDAQPERIGRAGIGAEDLGARRAWPRRRAGHARADRRAGRRRGAGGRRDGAHPAPRRRSCDSRCSGTARRRARPSTSRRRSGVTAASRSLGRHQHARRADAALRRAMGEEGPLQRRAASPSRARPSTVVDLAALDLAQRHQAGADLARRRAAPCRRRNRRRRSRPWCRSGRVVAQHVGEARRPARRHSRRRRRSA